MGKKKLTQERLKELLHYDPDTGVFTWLNIKSCKIKSGAVAGGVCRSSGYRRIGIDGKQYKAARLAFLYINGYLPENLVDHKDRDRLNDKWDNLREASYSCNRVNRTPPKNKSNITGVRWDKKLCKWVSYITKNGKKTHIGCFENKKDAVVARYTAECDIETYSCVIDSAAHVYLKERGVLRG